MTKMIKKFIFFLLLALGTCLYSQNEAQKWYFGQYTGLDFATNPPSPITGTLNGIEGTAVICNSAGALLFYTDGMTIYNQMHQVMANGSGLAGHFSTTQASIIVKKPASNSLYYVFTLDQAAGSNGLCYSIVDMSLAAGMGSVTTKNYTLYAPSTEKLAAVKHCNGIDTWVVTRDMGNKFRSFLLDASGVNLTPVLSLQSFWPYNAASVAGQMKIAPNGKKIACAISGSIPGLLNTSFEIYDFDPSSGIVSNLFTLDSLPYAYGCEFSPDATKFYGSQYNGNKICQWNLCAGSDQAVIASKLTYTATNFTSAMQLATDGKIYVMHPNTTSLSVINAPNLSGTACNFVNMQQYFGPNNCQVGLPSFVSSFFKKPPPPFTYSAQCTVVSFSVPQIASNSSNACSTFTSGLNSIHWNFGDPASATSNTAVGSYPSHQFSGGGSYTVSMILNYNCSSDTVKLPVTVGTTATTSLTVSGIFTLCIGESQTYTVSGASSYTWSNGTIGATTLLTPTVSSSYSVSGTVGPNCFSKKSFNVTVSKCINIEENKDWQNITAYPNPFDSHLFIETPIAIKCIITDVFGNNLLIQNIEAGAHKLEMNEYNKGIYFLTFIQKNQKKSVRFVKTVN